MLIAIGLIGAGLREVKELEEDGTCSRSPTHPLAPKFKDEGAENTDAGPDVSANDRGYVHPGIGRWGPRSPSTGARPHRQEVARCLADRRPNASTKPHRAGSLQRLIDEGELPERAERLVASWEAQATADGLERDGRHWESGWGWMLGQRC